MRHHELTRTRGRQDRRKTLKREDIKEEDREGGRQERKRTERKIAEQEGFKTGQWQDHRKIRAGRGQSRRSEQEEVRTEDQGRRRSGQKIRAGGGQDRRSSGGGQDRRSGQKEFRT